MSDIQKTIVVNGKEYVTQHRTGGCVGCAAFLSSVNGGSQCHSFPQCTSDTGHVIFVEKEAATKAPVGSHTPLAEVSRLCDQARADGYAKGYDEGRASGVYREPEVCDDVIFLERGVDGKPVLHSNPNVNPSKAYHTGYADGVARTSDPATSHKAANNMVRKAGRIADLILVELRNANLTGSALAARTGVALNSITPRFAQLSRKGLIHAAGGSGRETVWAIGNGIKS